ncbi:hypothetical protein H7F33_01015 [Pedobacter sp. PAMC26386]|nr:hypothetical protein H7F33_01015 [Pedobacter sp. PAMC26386]
MRISNFYKLFLLLFLFCSCFGVVSAQITLNKKVTVHFQQLRLTDVLKDIGQKESFYFSYNGNLITKDSLVTLNAENQPLIVVLNQLFQ